MFRKCFTGPSILGVECGCVFVCVFVCLSVCLCGLCVCVCECGCLGVCGWPCYGHAVILGAIIQHQCNNWQNCEPTKFIGIYTRHYIPGIFDSPTSSLISTVKLSLSVFSKLGGHFFAEFSSGFSDPTPPYKPGYRLWCNRRINWNKSFLVYWKHINDGGHKEGGGDTKFTRFFYKKR